MRMFGCSLLNFLFFLCPIHAFWTFSTNEPDEHNYDELQSSSDAGPFPILDTSIIRDADFIKNERPTKSNIPWFIKPWIHEKVTFDPTKTPSTNKKKSQMNSDVMIPELQYSGQSSSVPSQTPPNAAWMSGRHGISVRMDGGVSWLTSSTSYDATAIVNQISELVAYGITWFVVNLSSTSYGDRYLSPHSVLTNLNRGSTPKLVHDGEWHDGDLPLEDYDDRDLFGEMLDAVDSIGVRVIAHMAGHGPDMSAYGEERAYDYDNRSPYVDSCALCPSLTNTEAPFCECAPSVWRWRAYALDEYYEDLNGGLMNETEILKLAYAEKIVGEYAEKYGSKLAGFEFGAIDEADIPKIYQVVRTHNAKAVISFNNSQLVPLKNNNPPYEDFTSGLPSNIVTTAASDCSNYPAITSIESTAAAGYFYENGKESLGHIHLPLHHYGTFDYAWRLDRAQEWQSRVMKAKGAWTWTVKYFENMIFLHDIRKLKQIYQGLRDGPPYEHTCGERFTLRPSVVPSQSPTASSKPSKFSKLSAWPSDGPSNMPSNEASSKPSARPSFKKQDVSFNPSKSPSNKPSEEPSSKPLLLFSNDPSSKPSKSFTNYPSFTPRKPSSKPSVYDFYFNNDDYYYYLYQPSASPTKHPSSKPSIIDSQNPSSKPSILPSVEPSIIPTGNPTNTPPSIIPTGNPTNTPKPTITPTPNAAWMSGHHGISVRIAPGGVNFISSYFETDAFVEQVNELSKVSQDENGIRWVIVNLSSSYSGDRYLSPHSVLTNLNRGSTPKAISKREWYIRNTTLEQYDDRDLFGEILYGLDSIGVKVIAYMAAQGPAMLESGEIKAYDYNNNSPYVDSCALCPSLIGMQFAFCKCAPSVWHWKRYAFDEYNATGVNILKKAYAEIIVGEYASKYGNKLAGFVFDQAYHLHDTDRKLLRDVIQSYNSDAVIAFNIGQRVPLKYNNAPYEDFTYGYPKHLNDVHASDCENYPAITSIEDTSDGFFHDGGKESLGHFHVPIKSQWEGGYIVWSTEQAQEWQSRVLIAKGAWTWAVQLGNRGGRSKILDDSMVFLKNVYLRLHDSLLYRNSSLDTYSCEQSLAPSVVRSMIPTTSKVQNHIVDYSPSTFPTVIPSKEPSIISYLTTPTAEWMSGHHGVSFRIPCGVSYVTSFYDVDGFIRQFNDNLLDYGLRWVIVNLSSSFHGDRYLSPHSVLTNLNRGSTPKAVPKGEWKTGADMPLEQYDDRDLFGEILYGLDSVGVNVIAYMSAQGPTMLLSGERNAYDYKNKSPYVDSCALCPSLTNTLAPFCGCAPSVWKWKKYVAERYDSGRTAKKNLKKAFAEIIVGEYASKYGKKLAGFVFDQASPSLSSTSMLYKIARAHNPMAVLSFANGGRIPLQLNNYPYEDFTFGYPNSLRDHMPSSCKNYPAITSVESTTDGFFHLNGKKSLCHIHTPINRSWTDGNMVWTVEQAREWQSRMINAKGAWTWGVKRGSEKHFSLISLYDLEFLKRVYDGLRGGPPYLFTCEQNDGSRIR